MTAPGDEMPFDSQAEMQEAETLFQKARRMYPLYVDENCAECQRQTDKRGNLPIWYDEFRNWLHELCEDDYRANLLMYRASMCADPDEEC